MNKDERIRALEYVIKETFWMARRYAHGRNTYTPQVIRDSYNLLKRLGIDIRHDITIQPPTEDEIKGMTFRTDYLDDCNE